MHVDLIRVSEKRLAIARKQSVCRLRSCISSWKESVNWPVIKKYQQYNILTFVFFFFFQCLKYYEKCYSWYLYFIDYCHVGLFYVFFPFLSLNLACLCSFCHVQCTFGELNQMFIRWAQQTGFNQRSPLFLGLFTHYFRNILKCFKD